MVNAIRALYEEWERTHKGTFTADERAAAFEFAEWVANLKEELIGVNTDEKPIDKLLDVIRTWMESESGPTTKFSHPELQVQVTIRGYKKLILERTFKE